MANSSAHAGRSFQLVLNSEHDVVSLEENVPVTISNKTWGRTTLMRQGALIKCIVTVSGTGEPLACVVRAGECGELIFNGNSFRDFEQILAKLCVDLNGKL